MNNYEYKRACSYARKLTPFYRDVVHDAYLDHYNRTGEDLFDSPNRTIVVTVRNHFYNNVRSNRYMYNGKYYQKVFIRMNAPGLIEGTTQEQFVEAKFNYHSQDSLMDDVILKDQVNVVKDNITTRQAYLLDKAIEGYTIMDLAKLEGINQSSIRKSFGYIKCKAVNLLNER